MVQKSEDNQIVLTTQLNHRIASKQKITELRRISGMDGATRLCLQNNQTPTYQRNEWCILKDEKTAFAFTNGQKGKQKATTL